MVWVALVGVLTGCSPTIREPNFVGARDRVTDVTLLGPFDGQVLDDNTSEPIQGASVVAIWSYDQGDGLLGPAGSEVIEVKTDQAGRYRIPEAPLKIRGAHVRLVSFELVVYKRGYVGYRSNAVFEGGARSDFALRQNRVKLRKWRETDSHAQHLLFLEAPPTVEQLAKWERRSANLDLYREQVGLPSEGIELPSEVPEGKIQVLDASEALPPREVRRRTNYTDAFDVKELGDLSRTHFYHGVHLQARGRDESWDVAYRVWKDPPGGLDGVQETFEATLPGIEASPEITDETWLYDAEDVRAVAFLDRERKIGVLLTCGGSQCVDIESVIILAKFLYDHLDEVKLVNAADDGSTPASKGGKP
jgi:hypothetical protein